MRAGWPLSNHSYIHSFCHLLILPFIQGALMKHLRSQALCPWLEYSLYCHGPCLQGNDRQEAKDKNLNHDNIGTIAMLEGRLVVPSVGTANLARCREGFSRECNWLRDNSTAGGRGRVSIQSLLSNHSTQSAILVTMGNARWIWFAGSWLEDD